MSIAIEFIGTNNGKYVFLNHVMNYKKITIITTSWDDGHPLDIRLAELLEKYGIKGTFYVPIKYDSNPILDRTQLDVLGQMDMEIGSHTMTHPFLTRLNTHDLFFELCESKKILEDMCQRNVSALCYPGGKFNRNTSTLSRKAGYRLARTTCSFRTELQISPMYMPVTIQLFPHTLVSHLKHGLKEWNVKGLMTWCKRWGLESDLIAFSDLVLRYVLKRGGIFHIWGHSWEIDRFGLWEKFEEILRNIAHQQGVYYLTNSQALDLINENIDNP